jgi:phosphoglucosamine mutase
MRADAGLMISASHNPYQDNGIKIFAHNGHKLPDAEESEIEELITSGRIKDIRPTAGEIGKARRIDDAAGRYVVFCKNTFPEEVSLEGMKIVLDCANGATYKIAPTIFTELGAEVVTIHDKPNGTNINLHCGSQHTQDLKYKVLETKAHAGLAFDGDGDRVIVVDNQGNELTGDHVLAICGKDLKDRGKLVNNLVVTTVMANFGLYKALKQLGIDYVASQVGDRYVLEAMKEKGAVIGGEASGHTIFLDHHSTGDGIISALQLLSVVQRSGESLSSLASIMQMTPQRLVNIDVKSKPPLEDVAAVQEAIKQAEAELKDDGRVLIRYSGTQSMCRVMVEGPTEEMTDLLVAQLADVVKASIG